MSADEKAAELVKELNALAEEKYKRGEFAEAEERFRTALGVYKEWAQQASNKHTAVLSTISGLVKTLEVQGKRRDAADVLEAEESTITAVINMLRQEVRP